MHQPVDAALGDRREVRQRRSPGSRAPWPTAWPWKLPPLSSLAVLEHERIVGGGVELARDDALARSRARRAPDRAPAACSAARTRPARADRRSGATRGSRCRASRARSSAADCALSALPARVVNARVERDGRAEQRFERHRAGHVRRRARARAHRARPARRCAVCACVPLMSASPSFGCERHRREPGARAAASAAGLALAVRGYSVPFADQRQREVRERREVAARAHAALLRDRRADARR